MDRNKEEVKKKDSRIDVRVHKSVRDMFMDKVKGEGVRASSVLKGFVYDYIGDSNIKEVDKAGTKNNKVSLYVDDTYIKFRDICRKKNKSMNKVMNDLLERYVRDREHE